MLSPSRPLLVAAVLFASLACAQEQSKELVKAENAALRTVEKEFLKLARFAAKKKDYTAAKAELKLGLRLHPAAKKLQKELDKLGKKKKKDSPKAGFARTFEDKRKAAHEACGIALADLARLYEEAGVTGRYTHYVELIQTGLPSKPALQRLDLAYFKPYFKWVSQAEAKRLESGGELVDGEWLDSAAVKELDRKHSTWSDPWVISDSVHEIRTTKPLRIARRLLAYLGAYRKFFLAEFGEIWDLKPPKGKLPVIVTETQADQREQMQAIVRAMGGAPPSQGPQGAAYYLFTNFTLNPCFVTFEPTDATGRTFKIDMDKVWIPFTHEITHQIAFEYSKHDYNATRAIQNHFWAVEAIANFMCYHVFDGTRWRLTHPRTIPMGGGYIEGPFAHCVANKESLPRLKDFFAIPHARFMTVNNYHIAATVAYFLLTWEDGKYRRQFAKLLEAVHKVKDQADTFETCFPGVDHSALQQEWIRFVGKIRLDD